MCSCKGQLLIGWTLDFTPNVTIYLLLLRISSAFGMVSECTFRALGKSGIGCLTLAVLWLIATLSCRFHGGPICLQLWGCLFIKLWTRWMESKLVELSLVHLWGSCLTMAAMLSPQVETKNHKLSLWFIAPSGSRVWQWRQTIFKQNKKPQNNC